MGKKCIKIWR